MPRTDTKKKIIDLIKTHGSLSPSHLVHILHISPQALFRHLKVLCDDKILIKQGTPPHVAYQINTISTESEISMFSKSIFTCIQTYFLYITPEGRFIEGVDGFVQWCVERNFDPIHKGQEYYDLITDTNRLKTKENVFDGTDKFKNTFKDLYIDKVYYSDFYALPKFGKTKLGQLLLYAKQSQDIKMMSRVVEIVQGHVNVIIRKHAIDAVVFVPPTIKRNIQFMKVFQKKLDLKLPILNVHKLRNEVIIPQKTLGKLEDRVINAKKTFEIVDQKILYKNILLIDDAVGSGATFNEIAKKIKEKKHQRQKVIAFAVTGSLKGFDVISEV